MFLSLCGSLVSIRPHVLVDGLALWAGEAHIRLLPPKPLICAWENVAMHRGLVHVLAYGFRVKTSMACSCPYISMACSCPSNFNIVYSYSLKGNTPSSRERDLVPCRFSCAHQHIY